MPYICAALFCIGFVFAASDYYRHKRDCTEVIYGTVTNSHSSVSYQNGKRRTEVSADIVVRSDGVFPSQTIPTTSSYYARLEGVKIYYDPDDPSFYYFEHDLSESLTLCILLAVLAAGEAAFGKWTRKIYLKSLRDAS